MIEGTANTIIIVLFGLIFSMVNMVWAVISGLLDKELFPDKESVETQDFMSTAPLSLKIASFTLLAFQLMIIVFLIILTNSDILTMNWAAFLIAFFAAGTISWALLTSKKVTRPNSRFSNFILGLRRNDNESD